ncbi:HAD family hydrolase [Mucilaginibacter sp. L196]|uniref:HAD family hydrolase n=1 Tax=Mucilaginibacter sp. L196 TaxID=1641870 RepID=UPI00131CA768|nr:HAD family hydrolase [Mucilaginibacter sp. L196]
MKSPSAIIYDLDNTIYPVSAISKDVASPVFNAILDVGKKHFPITKLQEIMNDCYRISIREIIKKYEFPVEMVNIVEIAFDKMTIDYQLDTYSDYPAIKNISGRRFLVTSGHFKFQNLKIDNLSIRKDFDEIFIHDDDDEGCIGKTRIFTQILKNFNLDKESVIIVGDSINSEIAAGKNLELITVQILRHGVKKSAGATHYIKNFHDLAYLIKKA